MFLVQIKETCGALFNYSLNFKLIWDGNKIKPNTGLALLCLTQLVGSGWRCWRGTTLALYTYSALTVFAYLWTLFFFFPLSSASIISPNVWLVHMSRMKGVDQKHKLNLIIYGSLVGSALLLAILRGFLYYYTTLRCSENLHDRMVMSILKAPVLFYDTNPSGRIMNRFSKDIGIVDEFLPPTSLLAIQYILQTLAAVCVTCWTNNWAIIGVVPMLVGFYFMYR